MTWSEFEAFARTQGYAPKHRSTAFAALQRVQPQALAEVVAVSRQKALLLAQRMEKSIEALYHSHPDSAIYDSLPGAGNALPPAPMSKLDDDRERFPSPATLHAFVRRRRATLRRLRPSLNLRSLVAE